MVTMPLKEGAYTLSSGYGPRWGTFHAGLDFAAPLGTPIYAVADGVIIEGKDRAPGSVSGFGNWIWQDSQRELGVDIIYGHMRHHEIYVRAGDRVTAGQLIARVGSEGGSTGPHLHFEVWGPPGRVGGKHQDPAAWLKRVGAGQPTKKEAPMSPALINSDPVDADWSQKFGFGNPRSTNGMLGICIHTTENPIGSPAEGVANYQINTETGSYHVLVDNTTNDNINSIRENTDDWMTWSAGPKGNQIALHLSFVAYARCTRAEWLAADRMLNEGADAVAYWVKRYGFPAVKINGADLLAGRRGIFGHADVSAAWREVDHTDPGPNFPWDVFLAKVKERLNPTQPQGGTAMTELSGVSAAALNDAKIAAIEARDRAKNNEATTVAIEQQLAGPRERDGKQLYHGWPQLGGRTLVDGVAAIGTYLGIPGFSDPRGVVKPNKHNNDA